jgi:ElaB/YqjD/DUF883 family membrane-anchored ribosome-binding protein
MNLHQRVSATLVSAFALFAGGCTGDQVESGADATARGLDKAGGAVESVSKSARHKLEDAAQGTKVEKAADSAGAMIEKGGVKTHEALDAAGEKIKDVAPKVGQAVEHAGDKLKEVAKETKEKAGELKEKAGELLQKGKDAVSGKKD